MLGALFPRNRVKVLALLLGSPSTHYYLREIARLCGIPLRAVQRELAIYEGMRLVTRVPRGKQVFFSVNTDHPLFAELQALVRKGSLDVPAVPASPSLTVSRTTERPAASLVESASAPAQASARSRSWRVW